jgi:hypothetical protein
MSEEQTPWPLVAVVAVITLGGTMGTIVASGLVLFCYIVLRALGVMP